MDKKITGRNIRKLREDCGMTIEQLAEKTGLSDNFIGNIERGNDVPSLKSLIKISNALCASVDVILGENLAINISYAEKSNDFYTKEIMEIMSRMNSHQKSCILDCINSMIEFNNY